MARIATRPGTLSAKTLDRGRALVIERQIAAWIAAHDVVPGAEVHRDPDVTWMVQPGSAWGNTGTMLRFTAESAPRRLDDMIRRYRSRGFAEVARFAFWYRRLP